MEDLLIGRQISYTQPEVEELDVDGGTTGETVAVALLLALVLAVAVVGAWSTVLFLTGNTAGTSPVGLIFNLVRSAIPA